MTNSSCSTWSGKADSRTARGPSPKSTESWEERVQPAAASRSAKAATIACCDDGRAVAPDRSVSICRAVPRPQQCALPKLENSSTPSLSRHGFGRSSGGHKLPPPNLPCHVWMHVDTHFAGEATRLHVSLVGTSKSPVNVSPRLRAGLSASKKTQPYVHSASHHKLADQHWL